MSTRIRVEPLEARVVPAAGYRSLPVLPFTDAAVLDNARAIVARGQPLGRRTDGLVKAGDSNTYPETFLPNSYLAPLGAPDYDPRVKGLSEPHPELVDTWTVYHDWFPRVSRAADVGWTSADVLAHIAEEVEATDAGVALVMVGTNDIFHGVTVTEFRQHMLRIARTLSALGVVPVLSTLPDIRYNGGAYHAHVLAFNQVIADVAARCRVPLWNFGKSADRLPNAGVDAQGTHLSVSPNGGGSLWPADLGFGQNVRNLQALQILDWFRETVVAGEPTLIPGRSQWQPMPASQPLYAVGRDAGISPTVDVYNADTGARVNRFLAFPGSFGGGVRVATGDVNGDGFTDVVCATGAGTVGAVRVFSGEDGSRLAGLRPFGNTHTGGLSVAAGDLDGNGTAEIVVGAGAGTGVRVYHGGDFALLSAFRAFAGNEVRGVNVAVAEVAGVGPEVAVAAANTGGVVRLFSPAGVLRTSRHPYGGSAAFGLSVAAVDLTGDGFDELAVAPTSAVKPVRVVDPNANRLLGSLTVGAAFDGAFGLRLGTLRSVDDGPDTLLVGNGPGVGPEVRGFDDLAGPGVRLPPNLPHRAYGIFVG